MTRHQNDDELHANFKACNNQVTILNNSVKCKTTSFSRWKAFRPIFHINPLCIM